MKAIGIYELTQDQLDQAEKNGISHGTLRARLTEYNWTLEKALTTPPKQYKKWNRELMQRAKENGISDDLVRRRVYQGMSLEEAVTTPIQKKGHGSRIYPNWVYDSLKKHGINKSTFHHRVSRGWDLKRACGNGEG